MPLNPNNLETIQVKDIKQINLNIKIRIWPAKDLKEINSNFKIRIWTSKKAIVDFKVSDMYTLVDS